MKKKSVISVLLAFLILSATLSSATALTAGDVNGDGKVSAADARFVLRASVELEKLTDEQFTLADMDKNSKITAADARKILRLSVGLRDEKAAEVTVRTVNENEKPDGIPKVFSSVSSEAVPLIISTDSKISDFRVYHIDPGAKKGADSYYASLIKDYGELAASRSVVIYVQKNSKASYGYAVSYKDTDGTTKYYAIERCGNDITVKLTPIKLTLASKPDYARITGEYADRVSFDYSSFDVIKADTSEYSWPVLIMSDTEIKELQIHRFSYEWNDLLQDSEKVISGTYDYGTLKPFTPVLIYIAQPMDFPCYMMTYTDIDGKTKTLEFREPTHPSGDRSLSPINMKKISPEAYDTGFRTAYKEIINSYNWECTYNLFNIDSDGIPELFVNGSHEAMGDCIYSYKNGEITKLQLSRLNGGSFIPGSGLVHNFNGKQGYYYDNVSRLTDSGYTVLFSGHMQEFYISDGNFGMKYYITDGENEKQVSEDEYYNALSQVFNTPEAEYLTGDYTFIEAEDLTDAWYYRKPGTFQ